MKYHELIEVATELLYYFGPGVKEFDSVEERDRVCVTACEFIQETLKRLGAGDLFEGGKLNRHAIVLAWASVMLEIDESISLRFDTRDKGIMLEASLERSTRGYPKTYTVRQLFFWNDTRSVSQARFLVKRRADELIEAIKADSN